jgi:UDP-N-acetylmuramate--alanine ligase
MPKQKPLKIKDVTAVHCVGIGGVGVSAVARFFCHRGADVSGSDASMSPVVAGLRKEDIDVTVGHDADNVPADVDMVVHSIAVPHNNPELNKAREAGIPTLTYPETIGLISKNMHTLAVSGTHGKTTTTAMLADIFADSTRDPTVIVGSMLKDSHTNFVPGDDNLFVVEACEYKRSFLHLYPNELIITNIDTDHLDYFDDLADIQDAFAGFVDQVSDDGAVICNPQSDTTVPVVANTSSSVIDYTNTEINAESLQVLGEHNKENAQAAVAAAREIGVDSEVAKAAVRNFSGTWRRAQKKGVLRPAEDKKFNALIYDDYGHHPTEIRSTLAGFRDKFSGRKLIVIFQPHLFSRTKKLLDEFATSFSAADQLIILPIYAAREAPEADISSRDLVEKTKKHHPSVSHADDFTVARRQALQCADEDSLILTQGAGDVYEIADKLVSQ